MAQVEVLLMTWAVLMTEREHAGEYFQVMAVVGGIALLLIAAVIVTGAFKK